MPMKWLGRYFLGLCRIFPATAVTCYKSFFLLLPMILKLWSVKSYTLARVPNFSYKVAVFRTGKVVGVASACFKNEFLHYFDFYGGVNG